MKDERLIVLLDAFLDGTLSPAEKQELERMLLESDAARRQFWDRASLHGWTYAAAKLNYSAQPVEVEVPRGWRMISLEACLGLLRRTSQLGWRIALGGVACAVALLLWLGIRGVQPIPEDSMVAVEATAVDTNLVATITRGAGVVWDGETNSAEIGATLASQWLRLKAGAVQIEFYDGARVILEGPASLKLVSSGMAQLEYGKLTAHVPEPAHGFKIETPDVTVTDLGTEFGLDREPNRPVKVQVFEGKVEVAATKSISRPKLLVAGEAVKANANLVQPLPLAERPTFMSVTELARRESAELQQRYQNWRDADRALETDPSSLVHLNFEDQRDMDRSLSNRASGAKTGSRAMIFGCDWGEGRWPSKGALEFNSVDDRVRVGVPGVFRSLTYLAWLRVDSLPNQWNALALVDTFRTGETHWQIHRDGSVELSVRVEGGVASWDRLVSPPVITPEHYGKWIQLAAVYDGESRKMFLYANGREVASKPVDQSWLLTLGTMELGNWSPASKRNDAEYRVRNFHGRMDEFALLSRPLSAEEIRRLYDLGKPREVTTVAGLPPIPSTNP